MPWSRIMSFLGIRSMTVRYGFIHLSSPVMRCHHQRQGSAPSFSNSSQTGGGGGSGVWTLLELLLEPLDDDDDEPLDDDEDEEDDDVLSSSLSTSFFARRGLSLTPPRRGLSLMPRASIVYVGRRRMVMAIGAVRLGCPSWLSRRRCRGCAGQQHLGRWAGAGKMAGRRTSLERSAVRGDGPHRLPAAPTSSAVC